MFIIGFVRLIEILQATCTALGGGCGGCGGSLAGEGT
jgi:Fe-S cluster biogenesis protein NfuA